MKHYSISKTCHIGEYLRLDSMTDKERKALLEKHGSELWAMHPHIFHVEYSSLNRVYRGYGIKNVNGGIEFINPKCMDEPMTLKSQGYIVAYNKKKTVSKSCCLFFDFPDYLSFLAIQRKTFLQLPDGCDCYIMSHVKNYISMVVETDGYEKIYMFFPNTEVGITIAKTIEARNPRHVYNCSLMYAASKTLKEFAEYFIDKMNKTD